MTRLSMLPKGATPAALGSVVSLGVQAAFAIFLLRQFSPGAVGLYSVIAQVAWFWATLALAQGHVSLLVHGDPSAGVHARQLWRDGLLRMLWLAPLALVALWWGNRSGTGVLFAWAATLGVFQMGWLLAQSLMLRQAGPWSIALVRVAPQFTALVLTGAGLLVLGAWTNIAAGESATLLLVASAVGYAVGAGWLLPSAAPFNEVTPVADTDASRPARPDQRSHRLKMLHSLVDGVVATVLALAWQAQHGAVEAGYLLLLLRVVGFVPGLIHTAWAQVLMTGAAARTRSSHVGWLGAFSVGVILCGTAWAVTQGWVGAQWAGMTPYLWTIGVWQASVCVFAAQAHRPFHAGREVAYSWWCIAIGLGALVILLCPVTRWGWTAQDHALALSAFGTPATLVLALWMARLPGLSRRTAAAERQA